MYQVRDSPLRDYLSGSYAHNSSRLYPILSYSYCSRNKASTTTIVDLRDMGQGIQHPIQLLGGRKHCSDVQWWLRRGSLVYRSCSNHSQLQHTLRANCNGHEGRLKWKYSIADPVQLREISILYTIGSHPTNLRRRRHLRGQRSIRLSRNRTDQLCPNRQTGFERERSMVKRLPILHYMLRGSLHVAVRPPVNHRRGIRGSRLHLRAHRLQYQRVRCEAQLNRADSVAARLRGPEQPVLRSLLCPSDPRRRIHHRRGVRLLCFCFLH